jgi:hypothetical protein
MSISSLIRVLYIARRISGNVKAGSKGPGALGKRLARRQVCRRPAFVERTPLPDFF